MNNNELCYLCVEHGATRGCPQCRELREDKRNQKKFLIGLAIGIVVGAGLFFGIGYSMWSGPL